MEKIDREKFRTIPLLEVKKMLGYTGKGFRNVIRWCQKKKVQVLGEGRRRRILETEWIYIQKLDLINSIKLKFPDSWKQVCLKRGIKIFEHTENKGYKAKGNHANNLLKKWK